VGWGALGEPNVWLRVLPFISIESSGFVSIHLVSGRTIPVLAS